MTDLDLEVPMTDLDLEVPMTDLDLEVPMTDLEVPMTDDAGEGHHAVTSDGRSPRGTPLVHDVSLNCSRRSISASQNVPESTTP